MADEHHNSFDLYDSLEGARNGQSTDDEGSPSSTIVEYQPDGGGIVRKKPPPLNIVYQVFDRLCSAGKYLLHELMDPFVAYEIYLISRLLTAFLYIYRITRFPLFLQSRTQYTVFTATATFIQKC